MIEGEKMKGKMHYLMVIFLFVSLLVEQFGCAHTSQRPSREMTARSAKDPELNTPATRGQGFNIAKGVPIGMGRGALLGVASGARVGTVMGGSRGNVGAGLILLPILIGGVIGGLSGGIAGGVDSAPTADQAGIPYNTWKRIRFAQVDSLQPALQWKAFPTARDIKANKIGELSRVSDVTYELKILRAQGSFQGDVVYTRTGLQEPSHHVECPLIPLTRYFWSVRVRFKLDDDYRETEWTHGSPFYTTM